MESQSDKPFVEATSRSQLPVDELVGQEDLINDAVVSERTGTRNDQYDMLRMGKTPQLKVC